MNISRVGPVDPNRALSFRLDESAAVGEHGARHPHQTVPRRARRSEDQQNPDSSGHRVAYSYDEKAHRYVMKLVDAESGEVIRQIPPEQLLRVAAEINRYLGVLLDAKR
ncbi:MAG: flagellar protein FlaG [Chloroflexota bacterium]|nr:flagellar protein FlaG [Dehalococcoidia bacterium]MDW8255337.1 flagellar protein FlaG [Chloroflexota bacterium]